MLAKWLAGKTYSRDIFRVEGFPLQRPDWRVIYCNDLLYVFPTRNIVNFLALILLFKTATYFSKARYSLFMLKVPLTPISQSYNTVDAVVAVLSADVVNMYKQQPKTLSCVWHAC